MTTLQKTVSGTAVASALAFALIETSQTSALQDRLAAIQKERTPVVEAAEDLPRGRDESTAKIAALQQENERLRQDQAEIAKLRSEAAERAVESRELAKLKAANYRNENDPTEIATKALLGKINLIKQQLALAPALNIPELRYLDDTTWALTVHRATLETEADVRKALATLRNNAKTAFAPYLRKALQTYAQTNQGALPVEFSQLKPYFDPPVEDALLDRYQMLQTGKLDEVARGAKLVGEKEPVDADFDGLTQIGLNSQSFQAVGKLAGGSGPLSGGGGSGGGGGGGGGQ